MTHQEIEKSLCNLEKKLVDLDIPFVRSKSIVNDLNEIHDLLRKTKEIRFISVIKDLLKDMYELMVDYKMSQGTSYAECVWAMVNQVKDINELLKKEEPAAISTPKNVLRRMEVEVLLDVIMLTTMNKQHD